MSIDVLLSGHAARQAYRNGVIDTGMPLPELEARSRVNDAALGTPDDDPEFSNEIRAGLPIPAGWAGGGAGPSTASGAAPGRRP